MHLNITAVSLLYDKLFVNKKFLKTSKTLKCVIFISQVFGKELVAAPGNEDNTSIRCKVVSMEDHVD